MSAGAGSVVGTAIVLVVPESKEFQPKVQSDVRAALAKVDGKVVVTADTKEAQASVEKLAASIEEQAAAAVAASTKEREQLTLLAAEYERVAAASVAGSEEQIAATKLATEAQRKLGVETAAAGAETSKSGGLLESFVGKLRGVGDQNNLVSKSFNEVEKSSGGAVNGIAALGPAGLVAAAGLLALAGGAAAGISKLVELSSQTKVLQRTTGATAEDASRFSFVLSQVGINGDSVSASLFRFNRNIQDHADKFAAAGVEVAKYADGTTNVLGTLDNLRQRLSGIDDVTERNKLLFDLLGRGALSMAAYLKLSNDQLSQFNKLAEETGHVLNQQTLDQTRSFQLELRELGARAGDLEISLGRRALPAVIGFFEALNTGVSAVEKGVHALDQLGGAHADTAGKATNNSLAHKALGLGLDLVGSQVAGPLVNLVKLGDAHESATKKAQDAKEALLKEGLAAGDLGPFIATLSAQEDTAALSSDKLATEAAKLKSKLDDVGATVGLTGAALLQMAGGDATAAEDAAKRISSAMDATTSSFKAAFSVVDEFSLSKLASEDKSAQTAIENLDKAQQNLADTREKQSAKTKLTVSDEIELRKAVDAVDAAQKKVNDTSTISVALLNQQAPALDRAKAALQAALPNVAQFSDTQKAIVNFYSDSLIQATTFSANIRTAIEQGYDPGLISELLQKGPKEAAPLLAALISDQTGTLKTLVNESEKALDEQGFYARESARITNLAINDTTSQRNIDFKNAMGILQQEAAAGGQATADEIATKLGIGRDEVIRIAKEMGIAIPDGITPGVDQAKGKVGELGQAIDNLPTGKTIPIDVDTQNAENNIARLRAKIDALGPAASRAAVPDTGGDNAGGSAPESSFDSGGGNASAPEDSGPVLTADQHEGGIVHYYASGGREIHQAFVARAGTPVRVFNEPETEGEGYIPLAQSKRPRSERVLAGIAKTFGGQYVRGNVAAFDMGGGWPGPASTVSTSTTNSRFALTVQGPLVAVNGHTGMAPEELAAAVHDGLEQWVASGALGQAMQSSSLSYR